MKYKYLLLVLVLMLGVVSCNQDKILNPDNSGMFIKFLGGALDDIGYSVEATPDGGFIIAGTTYSFGEKTKVYVAKTDANGNRQWEKSFGQANTNAGGRDVLVTANNTYLVVGYNANNQNLADILLLQISADGQLMDSINYGQPDKNEEGAFINKVAGGYVLLGNIKENGNPTDMYVSKIDENLTELYAKPFGLLDKDDDIGSILEANDQDLIWCGTVYRDPTSDMRIVRADPFANLKWDYAFGEKNGKNETGRDIIKVENGYLAIGSTQSDAKDLDVFLTKIDLDGNILWSKNLGGSGNQEGYSIYATQDGGYILTGNKEISIDNTDVYLVKIDAEGNEQWSKTFGGKGVDRGLGVRQTADGGYLIAALIHFENNYVIGLIKTNTNGEIQSK